MVRVEETRAGEGDTDAPAELLVLKKHEGLCREMEGVVSFSAQTNGAQTFTTELRVPSALSPGQYTIEVIALKDDRIVEQATVPITAQLVGLPAWLNKLAFNHATLYGILATVIAILGGLIIGLFFQGKGGGAH
jgi:hypothetical protein